MWESVLYVIALLFYSLTRIKRESSGLALTALLLNTLRAGVSNEIS
jgi:hypothetical protein